MQWRRTTSGRLVCDLGALRAVVERTGDGRVWIARVDTPRGSVASVYEYRSMREEQDSAERKLARRTAVDYIGGTWRRRP